MITYCFIKHIKTIAFIFCFLMTHVAYAQKIIVTPVDGYAARLLEGRDFEEENDIGTKELVSSKAMALQLAKIYVANLYGERAATSEKPYAIIDNGNEWLISGQHDAIRVVGGVFFIVISKNDGKVIAIMHGR